VAPYEIVLVAYHSRPLVEKLLRTLPAAVPVAIVDNAHDADGLAALAADRPGTRYLDGPGAGFAAGANLGATTSTHEMVVFVNPDSSPRSEQLAALVADLAADPRLAAVSATTLSPDGSVEIGVGGWEPSVGRAVVHAVGVHKILPTAGLWARPVPGRPVELDWLSGACMAVRRETFCSLGGFDDSFFVYSEDVAFGRRVREAGLRQKVRTDVLVPHLGGGSGEARTRMLRRRGASMTQYVRRFRGPATLAGVRVALTAGYAARYLLSRARGRRSAAQEHVAYVQGLWADPAEAP
jgi:N-acetylglucosaminyl-diphospho-decaprenol L-rhamnosyltransferase